MAEMDKHYEYGAGTLYSVNCFCALCVKIRNLRDEALSRNSFLMSGGWADPRRKYLENEEDFLKRVPDGFLVWPEDHK
jgi:hypothetical protein